MATEPLVVRTTGRIKKPKLVFDPSDYDIPRPKHVTASPSSTTSQSYNDRSSSAGSSAETKKNQRSPGSSASGSSDSPSDTCFICFKREAKRGIHSRNKMIHCQQCDNKAHRLCLPIDFEDMETLIKNYKCHNCKSCSVCMDKVNPISGTFTDLMTCCKCVRSFHLDCHKPIIQKIVAFSRNWHCSDCDETKVEQKPQVEIMTEQKHEQIIQQKLSVQQKQMSTNIPKSINNGKKEASDANSDMVVPKRHEANINHTKLHPAINVNSNNSNTELSSKKKIHSRENSVAKEPQKQRKMSNATSLASSCSVNTTAIVSSSEGTAESTNGLMESKVNKSLNSACSLLIQGEACSHSPTTTFYNALDPLDLPNDVKFWDVDQVATYFSKFFPREAHVFKEQEIDGMSLLLLKRSDVIKKLPIKLGPALRMYNLILKIQSQVNDATLGWNIGQ